LGPFGALRAPKGPGGPKEREKMRVPFWGPQGPRKRPK